jgi:hypothetical protein
MLDLGSSDDAVAGPLVVGKQWIGDVERSGWSVDVAEIGESPSGGFASMYLAGRHVEAQCKFGDTSTVEPPGPWSRAHLFDLLLSLADLVTASQPMRSTRPSEAVHDSGWVTAHPHGDPANPSVLVPTRGDVRTVPESELWKGFFRIVAGICVGTLMIGAAIAILGLDVATWPVWLALLVMGFGLASTGIAFAGDLLARSRRRTVLIVDDDLSHVAHQP